MRSTEKAKNKKPRYIIVSVVIVVVIIIAVLVVITINFCGQKCNDLQ